MRDHDVFGKRIRRISFVFVIVFLFGAVIATRFGVLAILERRIDALAAAQAQLQEAIDDAVAASSAAAYHEIGAIATALPDTFDQIAVTGELALARDLAGFGETTGYAVAVAADVESPFTGETAATVKAVRVTVSMTVADPTGIPDYLAAIAAFERIYCVGAVDIDYLDAGATLTMTIYTFYNDVDL